jgi:hypothetical protein
MTDLRTLLEDAAGPEPALTDQELAADLGRGRRAVRRRRAAAIAAAAAGTVAVIGVTWAVLPGTSPSSEPPVAGSPTPTTSVIPEVAEMTRAGRSFSPKPWPPYADEPVKLVSEPITGGDFTCSLRPAGWVVRKVDDPRINNDQDDLILVDPDFDPEGRYDRDNADISVRPDAFGAGGEPPALEIVPKTDKAWDQFEHHRAGPYQAVAFGFGPQSGGEGEMFVRTGPTRLFQLMVTPHAGWDRDTALRFAGSCRFR